VKKYILFDHDGVLVDTEHWYYRAGERALAEIGLLPDPEPYLTALNRFGAPDEEALVVEDSARGLRSAVSAGIDCAIVYNEFTKSHDFSQAHYRIGPWRS
jgi:beta-phosphoglucomutase-like phosphatase (HAD superfamily)